MRILRRVDARPIAFVPFLGARRDAAPFLVSAEAGALVGRISLFDAVLSHEVGRPIVVQDAAIRLGAGVAVAQTFLD